MNRVILFVTMLLTAMSYAVELRAAGEKLYGVHWWDYDRPDVGAGPTGGWTVETVLTNSDEWQRGWWFEPLYQQVKQTHQGEIITRIDYTWNAGHTTVPAPSQMSAQNCPERHHRPIGRLRQSLANRQ
jgi:hypothetical protein